MKLKAKWNRTIPPAPITIRTDLAIPKRKVKPARSRNTAKVRTRTIGAR